jgi:hypothetical protein
MFFYSFQVPSPLIHAMKGKKILLSIWLATAAFCLLQIVTGPNGVLETARVRSDVERLELQLVTLEADNQRLQAHFDALRTSSQAVELEARQLGWYRAGDIPVKVIQGQGFRLPEDSLERTLVLPTPSEPLPDGFFRLAWFVLIALFYGLISLLDLLLDREILPRSLVPGVRLDLFRE